MIKSATTSPNKKRVKILSHMAPLLLKIRGLDTIVLMNRIFGDQSEGMVVHSTDSAFRVGYQSNAWNVEAGDWEICEEVVTLKNDIPRS